MAHLGPPVLVRDLFTRERAELLALLRALDPDDWGRPTVCEGWAVRDVVAHLLNDYVRRISGTRDAHAGAVLANDETLPAFLARINDEFVRGLRQASPRVLTTLVATLGEELDQVWLDIDLHGAAPLPVSWAQVAGEPSPAWLDLAREYTEFWVHQQQIRDAVGRPGADDPELLSPVLRTFARALPAALHHLRRPLGTTVLVHATGPGGGSWAVVEHEPGWRLVESPDLVPPRDLAEPAGSVTLSGADLWRLGSRGITPEQARDRGDTTGDRQLTDAATSLLAVVA